ncbi:Os12g0272100 [Oryza sativa Japonica Group]|uniref:Os12g0272100 protein n=1 Tax=Oryza sativa subsp. japonica TaxID=39947 RepID=C7JA84_ORYSJ|nr:Os12g0272100 [Oryza sativa Japonica Group]|eukprot:NP_001176894.1 Os12g0272100 [Oryza sativa Japonica Group]
MEMRLDRLQHAPVAVPSFKIIPAKSHADSNLISTAQSGIHTILAMRVLSASRPVLTVPFRRRTRSNAGCSTPQLSAGTAGSKSLGCKVPVGTAPNRYL